MIRLITVHAAAHSSLVALHVVFHQKKKKKNHLLRVIVKSTSEAITAPWQVL